MCDGRRPDGWWEDLTLEVNCSCAEWKNMHSTHTFVPIILKFDFKHLLAAQMLREPPQCFFPPPWWTQPHRVFHVFVLWWINTYTGKLKKSTVNTMISSVIEVAGDYMWYKVSQWSWLKTLLVWKNNDLMTFSVKVQCFTEPSIHPDFLYPDTISFRRQSWETHTLWRWNNFK